MSVTHPTGSVGWSPNDFQKFNESFDDSLVDLLEGVRLFRAGFVEICFSWTFSSLYVSSFMRTPQQSSMVINVLQFFELPSVVSSESSRGGLVGLETRRFLSQKGAPFIVTGDRVNHNCWVTVKSLGFIRYVIHRHDTSCDPIWNYQ